MHLKPAYEPYLEQKEIMQDVFIKGLLHRKPHIWVTEKYPERSLISPTAIG